MKTITEDVNHLWGNAELGEVATGAFQNHPWRANEVT